QLQPEKIDKNMIPSCIYSSPEIAQIGLTEQEVKHKEMDDTMSKFPFSTIRKAIIEDKSEGFVKIIIDKQTNDSLGVHMIDPNVTNMVSEDSLAKLLNAIPWEIYETIHPHPSLSDVSVEATYELERIEVHT